MGTWDRKNISRSNGCFSKIIKDLRSQLQESQRALGRIIPLSSENQTHIYTEVHNTQTTVNER